MKKIKGMWLESLIQWGIFSRKDILSGKVTKADIIKRVAQMSSQKKENRLVINLPEWIKNWLAKKAKADKMSMNQIIRIALLDYLTKEE